MTKDLMDSDQSGLVCLEQKTGQSTQQHAITSQNTLLHTTQHFIEQFLSAEGEICTIWNSFPNILYERKKVLITVMKDAIHPTLTLGNRLCSLSGKSLLYMHIFFLNLRSQMQKWLTAA